MKLPNYENAVITETKIRGYLLSTKHRDGRSKAAFFARLGFSSRVWEDLVKALLRHAAENEVAKIENSPFGTRYIIEGMLLAPDQRRGCSSIGMVYRDGRKDSKVRHCIPIAEEDLMVKELESVVLTTDLPEYGLKQGDIGTIVLVHGDGKGYEVEFMTLDGETVAVISLFPSQVRPIGRREIAHARPVTTV